MEKDRQIPGESGPSLTGPPATLTLVAILLCHPRVGSLLFSQRVSSLGQPKSDHSKQSTLLINSKRGGIAASGMSSFKVMLLNSHSCAHLHPSLVLTTEGCCLSCMRFELLLVQGG